MILLINVFTGFTGFTEFILRRIEMEPQHTMENYKMNTKFQEELRELINRNSMENGSDTPDFILSEFLNGCLKCFNDSVTKRSKWYGNDVETKDEQIRYYLHKLKDLYREYPITDYEGMEISFKEWMGRFL